MQAVLLVTGLPSPPADAAALFHARWMPQARAVFATLQGEDCALLIVAPEADHTHAEWRLAAARMLAREAAPVRVNIVGCDKAAEKQAFTDYLAAAPGITGQYLPANIQLASTSGSGSL